MHIEVIRRPEKLSPLQEEWNDLALLQEYPLLAYEWLALTAQTYCQNDELRVVVARDETGLRAIAPLMLSRRMGIPHLVLLGHAVHFEPSGFLYRDADDLHGLLDAIVKMGYPIRFDRVRFHAEQAEHPRVLVRRGSAGTWSSAPGSLYTPVDRSWEDFDATISARRRSDLRRARRRAELEGALHVEWTAPNLDEYDQRLSQLIQVEAEGWKGLEGTALKHDSMRREFYERYAETAARLGILRCGFLRVGARIIAAQLAIEYAQRLWILKIGHDVAFARASPGALLMHECVRYVFERRLLACEFLGHDEDWLHVWSRGTHRYWQTCVYPNSLGGWLARGVDGARRTAARVLRRDE